MKTFHRPSVEKIAGRMRAAGLSSFLVLAAVALLVGQCGAAGRRPTLQPGEISAAKAKTTGQHATKALASLPVAAQSAISASIGRDQSSYDARAIPGGFRTYSHADTPAATFTGHGVLVRAGGTSFGMAVEGIGRGNALAAVQAAEPQAKANRVEYRRGALTEWYENGPLGLEQGFDVAKAPARSAGEAGKPLTIALALTGGLTASLDSGGTSLTLKRPDEQAALRYTGLAARDAAGRELQAWLKLDGRRVSIQVNDAGARYPIAVDPFVQVAKLTASDGAASNEFGYSVAISGDTIVAGAEMATVGINTDQGAAYVFVEPSGGWASETENAKLTASDGAYSDYLGSSVAISGDTIVAGAYNATVSSNASQGAAYVFVEPGSGWGTTATPSSLTETAKLTASDGAANDEFGITVAVSGATVVAGAEDATIGSNTYQGAAYVFEAQTTGAEPAITSAANTTFTVGSAGSFTVTTTGTPAPSISLSGDALPSGVTFGDNGDGTATLAGTPKQHAAGTYVFTITASNSVSSVTQQFTLTVNPAQPALAFTSKSRTTFTENVPGLFSVTTTGTPTPSISESGVLPAGVSFSDNGDGTATLSGTPTGATGKYKLTFTASNGVSVVTQNFTLTVSAPHGGGKK